MTEAEWLASDDPVPMIVNLPGQFYNSRRKYRLFAGACGRLVFKKLVGVNREAVEVAERYADGLATAAELEEAHKEAGFAGPAIGDWAHPADMARWTAQAVLKYLPTKQRPALQAAQAALMREVMGNPFRPVEFAVAWRVPAVVTIAQAAYDERAWPSGHIDTARLAVLSDALEEAGCDNADILSHLRSAGPHVRGCWAVDLALGKS